MTELNSDVRYKPAHLLRPQVLIVEDEHRLRDLLLDVIPSMGCTATAAKSAEEALRIIQSDPPDVIVLDLQLPGMGGMELFSRVRQQWPDTQMIIVTGFGDLESARQAIRLDVVDFVTKPFHLTDIELALNKARKRMSQVMREAEPASAAPQAVQQKMPQTMGQTVGQTVVQTVVQTVPRTVPRTLADAEREAILAALERHGGNRTQAALELGISRRKLQYWLLDNEEK